MKRVRWGILSTAEIGVEKVIPAMQAGKNSEVTAIASRTPSTAAKVAKRLGIPKSHGSYEALLNDPDVDAIYNPLPNHLHVEYSIKAMQAGKHVLCEKPIALTSAEAETLLDATKSYPKLKVMEAFMYRHHPQWTQAKAWVDEGKLGEVHTIQSFFSYFNTDPSNIRNKADLGGGSLMDIGCYNISLARFLFGREPQRVVGLVATDPNFQTDRLATALLDFGMANASFSCSTQLSPYQRVNLFGTKARLEIEIPFNAPADRPCKMWYQVMGKIEEIQLDPCDQYTLQGEHLSAAILNDTEVATPLSDAVNNMRVIEAIKKSAATGSWIVIDT